MPEDLRSLLDTGPVLSPGGGTDTAHGTQAHLATTRPRLRLILPAETLSPDTVTFTGAGVWEQKVSLGDA